jgi:protein TonB
MKTHLLLAALALAAIQPASAADSAEMPSTETARPQPGWQHDSDELAVHALEIELLRNIGKQTKEADYPEEAREWNWSGTTLVQVLMGANGSMKDVSVQRSSGFDVLDNQALKMVRRVLSTRIPDRLKGREVTVTVPIGFFLGTE